MADYKNTKIAVVGMGHIGHYMRVCYEALVDGNLKDNVVLIKATERGVEEIEKEFGCPVVVADNLGAFRKYQPDVILVCPPPSQIPGVIESALVPYARERAAAGAAKPDILSFGPTPSVDSFYDKLGETANVVKILPNMFYETKGMFSAFLEGNFITFSDSYPWPEANKARLYELLKPLVNTYEVTEKVSVPLIGIRNAAHCLYDMCFVMSDVLNSRGVPGEHHQKIASVMRAALRENWDDMPQELIPCSMSDMPENIAHFAAQSIVNWVQGISDFCDADQMPANSVYFVRRLRMEAYLVTIGLYDREELNALTKKHATKGGICERSGIFFNEQCKEIMTKAFSDYLDGSLDEEAWWETWRKKGQDAALTVARHAARLAD